MLLSKLQENMKAAMLSKKTEEVQTLRFLISQIKNKEIEKGNPLTDEDILQIIKKQVKELEAAKEMFQKAGRSELVSENEGQITILSQYLPEELSDEELKSEIQKIIDENSEVIASNPKSLMGITVSKLKSQADPQRILQMLRQMVSL
jgi:uncharacterized protein YqeY